MLLSWNFSCELYARVEVVGLVEESCQSHAAVRPLHVNIVNAFAMKMVSGPLTSIAVPRGDPWKCWRWYVVLLICYKYLLICIQNQKIHNSISYLQVSTRNTAAKMFLTALHFASDVSAPIRTPLNQEQENWLTTSANGVIRNRKFYLPLREHGNKKGKTYFLLGLNPSRTFSPSCWHITQTWQKRRI